MFLSNPVKIFHAVCVLSMIFSGCSLWRESEKAAVALERDSKSDYPFTTREPDVFQTKIVIRSGGRERHMFLARDGNRRRVDFDVDTDDHRAVISTDRQYLLSFKRKTYTEQPLLANTGERDGQAIPLMNRRDYSEFEEIGREGSTIQFRARINESATSEIMIFFDENVGMPVREEFYSIDGDERRMLYAFELYDLTLTIDDALFEVPPGFRRANR
jgi:outer membrane lipoprotein-sorting protein